MQIIEKKGNIFNSLTDALVVPVNTKGVLGAGLAKQVKTFYPAPCHLYVDACREKLLEPGSVLSVTNANSFRAYSRIIFVATKDDWREPSTYEIIEKCAKNLKLYLYGADLYSVAVPALGCGLGGLDWGKVKTILLKTFANSRLDTFVHLYLPLEYKMPKSKTKQLAEPRIVTL